MRGAKIERICIPLTEKSEKKKVVRIMIRLAG